jgi:hypothetical protein
VVLRTEEAAPASEGWIFIMATVVIGAKTRPSPIPVTTSGSRKVQLVELRPAT